MPEEIKKKPLPGQLFFPFLCGINVDENPEDILVVPADGIPHGNGYIMALPDRGCTPDSNGDIYQQIGPHGADPYLLYPFHPFYGGGQVLQLGQHSLLGNPVHELGDALPAYIDPYLYHRQGYHCPGQGIHNGIAEPRSPIPIKAATEV